MEVAAITGHKTMQMVKRYTHFRAEDLVGGWTRRPYMPNETFECNQCRRMTMSRRSEKPAGDAGQTVVMPYRPNTL
jgi:hypothetical protein